MKTLSTPITNEIAAEQSGWVELYDIYLPSAISTPWGTTNVLRLCTLGRQFSFFTPTSSPEAAGTQGDAATYYPWPLKRQVVKSSGSFTDAKLEVSASNVTAEWATMLAAVSWYDVAIVIRQASPNIASPTALDCALLFSGLVDAARITNQSITLVCSNDLALLNRILPSENMHASCRFKWADDMCTAIRFKAANYKAKTVGSSSTTTLVKSAGLTEDTGSSASYGTDIVDALANASITTSSEQPFLVATVNVNKYRSGVGPAVYNFAVAAQTTPLVVDQRVKFITTAPTGFTAGTWYYVIWVSNNNFGLSATLGGSQITNSATSGPWTLNGENGHEGFRVKATYGADFWAFDTDADWGTVDNAYYVIPDAQSGLQNAALKPYIQFDFGSAKQPTLWRVSSVPEVQPEQRIRLIEFFSSSASNFAAATFEGYFQIPNEGGTLFDVLLPAASSARYWRICVRSRWAESLYKSMFSQVSAYEASRNYWQDGRITFDAATATAALRNVTRKVLASYAGEVVVSELPAAPASGDTFVIERGCARTFNACAARGNTENYGGFDDLPVQTVVR